MGDGNITDSNLDSLVTYFFFGFILFRHRLHYNQRLDENLGQAISPRDHLPRG
jgi:hypothetical protein